MQGMKIGYARVSTDEQNLDLQRHALSAAGCEVVFEDKGLSGAVAARPGLADALQRLGQGDTLVVWRLDRLGRSLAHLIETVELIGKAGAGFVSLNESIDTNSTGGRLVFHIMGALAEFERSLISDRTKAGLVAARRRGKTLGRPRKLSTHQVAHALEMVESGRETWKGMAAMFGVDADTLRRAVAQRENRPRVSEG